MRKSTQFMKKKMQKKTKENRESSVLTFDYVNEIRDAKTTIHRRQQDDNDFEINEYDSRKLKIVNRFEEIQSIQRNRTIKNKTQDMSNDCMNCV